MDDKIIEATRNSEETSIEKNNAIDFDISNQFVRK